MYQVIKLYGDFEPWWFLDDWKKDIIEEWSFSDFEGAKEKYLAQWRKLKEGFPYFDSRANYLAAFWDNNEKRWCEECDEDLQQYHSILLLKDGDILSESHHDDALRMTNAKERVPSACRLVI